MKATSVSSSERPASTSRSSRSTQSPVRSRSNYSTNQSSAYNTDYSKYSHNTLTHEEASSYNHFEPSNHYSTRTQYNRNRELYAPSSRTLTNQNDPLRLDFYSGSTRKAVPYNPNQTITPTHSVSRHKASHVYSEDEGIVVNSESDSSVSQFASYENREKYLIAAPPNQVLHREPYSRYPVSGRKDTAPGFEYTRYTWNPTNGDLVYDANYTTGNERVPRRAINSNKHRRQTFGKLNFRINAIIQDDGSCFFFANSCCD